MPHLSYVNWEFRRGGPPWAPASEQRLTFQCHNELLDFIAVSETNLQTQIRRRLVADAQAIAWHSDRTQFENAPMFSLYRKSSSCEMFHRAARAVTGGTASSEQSALVSSLEAEIGASRIKVSVGQVVFHGRGDMQLHTARPYPTFISASLDPTVAFYHARKRRSEDPSNRAVVYALTLREELSAFWGNGGSFEEWELLFQTRLTAYFSKSRSISEYVIVEATLGF